MKPDIPIIDDPLFENSRENNVKCACNILTEGKLFLQAFINFVETKS